MEIDAPVKIFVDRRKCRTDFACFEPFDCRSILASVGDVVVR
jgi:TPP-dependent indolepyruvate ferredoxin oxidoreductase alpha subunit